MRTVKIAEAPASEPLLLEEIKVFLKVDTTADDALITSLISSARVYAEKIPEQEAVDTDPHRDS